jgi:ferritin-like metal-binding protein YciE
MIESFQDGFFTEVADMLHAERQITKALPRMAQAAQSRELSELLEHHLEETEEQVRRLEQVFEMMGRRPHMEVCEGMQGILEEGKDVLHKAGEGVLRDALIIGAAQKVEHYEIASYGTLVSWAEQMGARNVAQLLERTLQEEKNADRNLTRIAESQSNQEAMQQWLGGRQGFGRQGRGFQGQEFDERRTQQWEFRGSRPNPPRQQRYQEDDFRDRERSRWPRDRYEDE